MWRNKISQTTYKTDRCLGCYQDINSGLYHEKCSKTLFGSSTPPELDNAIAEVETFAKEVLNKRHTVTGVQRKLSLYLNNAQIKRMTIVGTFGGNFIMKPQSADYSQMPENEDLCMHMASLCSIKTAQHGLIPMKDGTLAYVTKRFDRKGKKKFAVEDLCQLSELMTEQKYRASHEKTGKVIRKFSSIPGDDILRFFELIVFSYITGNNDMHLKNFSLITQDPNRIVMTPAYDLISVRLLLSVSEDPEEMALSINGKKNKLLKMDFMKLAENLKIPAKSAMNAIERICQYKAKFEDLIARSFLEKRQQEKLAEVCSSKIEKLLS